jgi:hypothetical protein
MKLARCPSCHGHLNLDTLVQDSSAKSLLTIVAKLKPKLATNIIGYVALWRPAKSDLNNARAVKLIHEVLELSTNEQALSAALEQTTLSIQAKRQTGILQPFKNHSYLCQVLKTTEEQYQQITTNTTKIEGSQAVVKRGFEESTEDNNAMFHKIQDQYRT